MIGAFWRNHRAAVLLGMVGLVALWSMLAFAALLVVGVSHCSQCDMTPYLMRRLGLSFPVAVLFGFMVGFAAAGLRPLLRPYLGARGAILLLLLLTLGLAWLAVPVGLRAVGFVQHRLEGADRGRDTGLGGNPLTSRGFESVTNRSGSIQMAARAYWKGQIRLALVSIPVEIFSATKSGATIAFNQIHEPTGKRVKYEKVVPGVGPVDPEEIVKGYQYEKGSYVLLTDEEIESAKLESKKTLELTQFVDYDDIDVLYYEKPYFVVPADDLAEEAFIVLREALRRTKKVALGQLALRGREYLVSLKPCGRGIVLETLRYADEVNKAQNYFRDIAEAKPDEELLDLAEALIERKTAPFDPSKYHDRYIEAVEELIERKRKGKTIHTEEDSAPARGSNVIDLMAALKRSIEKPGGKESGGGKASSGGGAKKTPPKPAAPKPAAKKAPAKAAPARKRA